MNGCQQRTRSHVSLQAHRRRTRRQRRGLSSDQLADLLIETLRQAGDRGLHPPLLLVALAGNSQLLAVRYDSVGVESAGACLFEQLNREDLFPFPVRVFVTDALDRVLHATRTAHDSPTSFQASRATHFGGRHAS